MPNRDTGMNKTGTSLIMHLTLNYPIQNYTDIFEIFLHWY